MNAPGSPSLAQVNLEVTGLIEQLHAIDERLEYLLAGQIDSVTNSDGHTMLLRRAQGHVRQSQNAKQAAIVNALPAHIAVLDRNGVIVSVNDAWRQFGDANSLRSSEHAIGINYLAICDAAPGDCAIGAMQTASGIRSVLGGSSSSFSLEYPCHSPTEQRWFLLTITPLAENHNNGAVVRHLDITERRQTAHAAAALAEQTERRERMFNTMLSSITDFAYIYDRDGRYLFANQPLLDWWGFNLDQVVGKNYLDLGYPPAVAAHLQQQIQKVFTHKTSLLFEMPYFKQDVETFYEHVYSPVFADDGTVDFVVGITRNTTERKRTQQALQSLNAELEERVATRTAELTRQEALFRKLAEEAPAIVWTLNASGTEITYINRAGIGLLGCTSEQWLAGSVSLFVHPDDLAATRLERTRALATSTPFVAQRRLRAADGGFRTMSCRASPVFDAAGKVDFWVGLDVDITEIKEVEDALRLSNHELEAFAYAIAHDLRSPLTLIDGFGRLLEKELSTSATPRSTHLLARMRAGVRQMDDVSAGLLGLAVLSRAAVKLEPVDVSQAAREVAELLCDTQPGRKVEIDIQDGMMALCDRGMLRSLLFNLLGNAWKFTSKVERAHISMASNTATGITGETTVYRIQDNGAGFDMHYAGKLFTPFQRLHSIEDFEGTGIGLATVRKIVERHGGTIHAFGTPGKGACMEFTLSGSTIGAAGLISSRIPDAVSALR